MILHRLDTMFHYRRRQRELRAEMEFHLEERVRELREAGVAEGEAARQARREFGAAEAFKEECRDAWGFRWWHDLLRDLSLSVRRIGQQKGHTAIVVLTFALCVSLNTFTFGLIDALMLNPRLYPDEDRLVFLWEGDNTFASGHDRGFFPIVLEQEIKDGVGALSDVAYYDYNLSHVGWNPAAEATELVENLLVGPDYFQTLRVAPRLGRAFSEEEVRGEGARVVILLHDAWQRNFAGDPGVVGKHLRLDGGLHEIVGVMPPGFVPPPESGLTRTGEFQLLLPLTEAFKSRYVARFFPFVGFNVVARLDDGSTATQAVHQIDAVKAQAFPERYARAERGDVHVTRLRHLGAELTRAWADKLVLLQGAALLILVLGCVNIAGLIAGRNLQRLRELAVRTALGASRRRLVGQLITESLVVSLMGGVVGVGFALLENKAASAAGMFDALAVDRQLANRPGLLFASIGLAAVAGAVAGVMALWPLVRRDDLDKYLKEDARTGTTGRAAAAWRDGLVTAQVALAVMLLIASGLLAKSFGRMLEVDLGFRTERLLMGWIKPPESFDDAAKRDFMVRLDREVQTMPGIEAATLANQPPMNVTGGPGFVIEGLEPSEGMPRPRCNLFTVGLNFMDVLGISVLRGRGFEASDFEPDAPAVILVDQLFVDRHLSDREPVGQRAHLNGRWWTIIGVAANVYYQDVTNTVRQPTIYQNYSQRPPWWFVVMLRTRGEPAQSIEALKQAIGRVDPDIGAFNFGTMDAVVKRSYADRTTLLSLSSVFSGAALLLVVLGIYGAMAQTVAGRTREIGVRMALGANPGRVIRDVLRNGLARFSLGSAIGLVGAGVMAKLIAAQLFATSPFDGAVYLTVIVVLMLAVMVACVGPARRAAKVDPMVALRAE